MNVVFVPFTAPDGVSASEKAAKLLVVSVLTVADRALTLLLRPATVELNWLTVVVRLASEPLELTVDCKLFSWVVRAETVLLMVFRSVAKFVTCEIEIGSVAY